MGELFAFVIALMEALFPSTTRPDLVLRLPQLETLQPAPAPVEGGPLSPNQLDLAAMAALDAQASLLRDLAEEPSDQTTREFDWPHPFECDPVLLADLVTLSVAAAPNAVLVRWDFLLTENGIADMPRSTPEENCALNQALLSLLDEATKQASETCRPIESALALASAISQVPPDVQPSFARDLSLLAQKQSDYRVQGRAPTDLCPEYRALEIELLSAIE